MNDGGSAFPVNFNDPLANPSKITDKGMTLRDYFAAKVLAGILPTLKEGLRPVDVATMAKDCYGIADAMLKARNEEAGG